MPIRHQVGLSSNHSPSKVCPKCEPHLASTAGSSSVQQGIPREPSFTRKKKLLGHEKQVTFTTDYTECGGSAVEDVKALKFKAGYRRVNDSAHPSTYQTNYRWIDPAFTVTPPLEGAEPPPSHEASCPLHGSGGHAHQPRPHHHPQGKSPIIAAEQQLQQASGHAHKVEPQKMGPTVSRDAVKSSGGSLKKKKKVAPVEPLPLPLSADSANNKGRGTGTHTAPLRTRDGNAAAGGKPREKRDTSQQPQPKTRNSDVRSKSKSPAGSAGGKAKRKRRKFTSPLKRLYEKDYLRQSLAKGSFETQYRSHYKDWGPGEGPMEGVGRVRRDKENAIPLTYGTRVLDDPSDPRYLKHLPPPPQSHYPPDLHWKTNYETHFVEPTKFAYSSGAWISPDPEPKPGAGGGEVGAGEEGGQVEEGDTWFDQLVELRKKADYYKWKSQRTSYNLHQALPISSSSSSHRATPTISTCSSSQDVPAPTEKGDPSKRKDYPPRRQGGASSGPGGVSSYKREMPPSVKAAPPMRGRGELVVEDMEEQDFESVSDSVSLRSQELPGGLYAPPPHPPPNVKCTCSAEGRPPLTYELPVEVRGRIPTPILRGSAAQGHQSHARHHLDLTTPSDQGILIPITGPSPSPDAHGEPRLPYPTHSVKYRRDMKSTAPMNPLSNEEVESVIRRQEGAWQREEEEKEEAERRAVSPVPRHISASGSPHHAHCVPTNQEAGLGKGKGSSPSPVRRLDFDRPTTRKSQSHPSPSSKPLPSTCDTCGASLQPASAGTVGGSATPLKSRPQGGGGGMEKSAPFVGKPLPPRSRNTSFSPSKRSGGKSMPYPTQTGCLRYSDGSIARCNAQTHSSNFRNVPRSPSSSPRPLNVPRPRDAALPNVRHVPTSSPPPSRPLTHITGAGAVTPPPHTSHATPVGYVAASLQPSATADRPRDVDEVSILSLSSCSVASGVLEKARHRRDHFWSSQHVPNE